jgi:hypothetical protein
VLIFDGGRVNPGDMRLEGLGELKESNDVVGIQTCDITKYTIAPEPTALPVLDMDPGTVKCGRDDS